MKIYTVHMKIRPSLLAANLDKLQSEIKSFTHSNISSIHIDIGDWVFVPSLMLPMSILDRIESDEILDVHLMVQTPSSYFTQLFSYQNIQAIAFHVESCEDISVNINALRTNKRKVWLAILPDTDITILTQYIDDIDYILVMTVKWGFSGEPFIQDVLVKMQKIHKKWPKIEIVADWGINLKTAQLSAKAWVNEVVIGSDLFTQVLRKEYINQYTNIKA